jgi:hypothetical protein
LNLFSIWQDALVSAWSDLISKLVLFLPVLLSAIVIFVLGLMISGWLSQLVTKLLKTLRFSEVAQSAGLDKFLKKSDIGYDSAGLIALAVKWLTILVFFMASTNVLGLTAVTGVVNNFLLYVPKVLTAALIVAVGAFFARFAEGLVKGSLATVDHVHAKTLAQLARWVVMLIAVLAAINELQVAQTLVETFFQGLTWTITLAVGLSVGLGAKDLISQILRDWYDSLKK